MDTSIWGPPLWRVLNVIAFRLGDDQANAFVRFVGAMADLMPCRYCRESFSLFCLHAPVEEQVGRPDGALHWVWYMHELVNRKLGYNSLPLTKLIKRLESGVERLEPVDVLLVLSCVARNWKQNPVGDRAERFVIELTELLRHTDCCHELGVRIRQVTTRFPKFATSGKRFVAFVRMLQLLTRSPDVFERTACAQVPAPCALQVPQGTSALAVHARQIEAEWKGRSHRLCTRDCDTRLKQAVRELQSTGQVDTEPLLDCLLSPR